MSSGSKARVLVVEDEKRIADLLAENLEGDGFRVAVAKDGEQALRAVRAGGIDLILLDVMLPTLDGFEVCRTLRKEGDRTPILFLTARDMPSDRVAGLRAGGDDYLIKPFHFEELLARIEALLRRQNWEKDPAQGRLPVGMGWVNLLTRESCSADGKRETLPAKEFSILKLLLQEHGRVVSRTRVVEEVWDRETAPTLRTVDNFVVRLRRRFEPDPVHPRFLLTIRGTGYRLVSSPEE